MVLVGGVVVAVAVAVIVVAVVLVGVVVVHDALAVVFDFFLASKRAGKQDSNTTTQRPANQINAARRNARSD